MIETSLWFWVCLAATVPAGCVVSQVLRESSLLAGTRSRVEAENGFLAEMLGCPFCTSFWVMMLLVGAVFAGSIQTHWSEHAGCRLRAAGIIMLSLPLLILPWTTRVTRVTILLSAASTLLLFAAVHGAAPVILFWLTGVYLVRLADRSLGNA